MARLNQKFFCIHIVNIATYTILVIVERGTLVLKEQYNQDGNNEQVLDYYKTGNINFICVLIKNAFQLYLDCFIFYIMLMFTKNNTNCNE